MNDRQQQSEQKRIGTGMYAMAWLAFMLLFGLYFQDVLDKQQNPNQALSTQYSADGIREVILQRNKFGHYVTNGEINGQPVVFMLDTGASGVVLPDRVARRLGIPRGPAFQTQTANGVGRAYATRLDSVSVGDIELRQVSAGITAGLQSEEVLLGMSFLKKIEFTQRGDTLILKQYP